MATKKFENPLLLLDNSNMNTLFNEGEFKCTNMTFEEAKEIIGMYDKEDILLCFTQPDTYDIIFNYIGVPKKDYKYKSIRNMRLHQDGIIFKIYTTPSETQPIIHADGVEAKKIQNIYVYCVHISRLK
ncbi:MAG: hypothetical protein K0S76_570 [Herbinix sp.]|jgi:hypothetical protein|nr:hypothetical protein [Herbinix sp.]